MFGYVIPNHTALSPEAQARYSTAYCGLCRRIDALHGLRGRFRLYTAHSCGGSRRFAQEADRKSVV